MKRRVIVFLVSLGLAACAAAEGADWRAKQNWSSFLEDGNTRKEEVLSRLGVPSGVFEDGRILTYRVLVDRERGLIALSHSENPPLRLGRDAPQLILVFDEKQVLERHKLLERPSLF